MTGRRYRSLPKTITAVVWTGDNADEVKSFVGLTETSGEPAFLLQSEISGRTQDGDPILWVEKSRSWCHAPVGTAIVAERDGSGFYPVEADEFTASYAPVEEDSIDYWARHVGERVLLHLAGGRDEAGVVSHVRGQHVFVLFDGKSAPVSCVPSTLRLEEQAASYHR